MSDNQQDEILKLGCEERYDYFLTEVTDTREIWILVSEDNLFLKIFSEDDNLEYLPIWPDEGVAQAYCKGSEEALAPKCISLPEFLKKWITGLQGDGLNVGVFPTATDEIVWIMEPAELKDDLMDVLSQF